MSVDHGQFSGIKGVTRAKQAKSIDREIDKALAQAAEAERQRELSSRAARKAIREAEARRTKFTAADLDGCGLVRDQFGWHRVVRVNAKSVTVGSVNSWTERIALDKILEARA